VPLIFASLICVESIEAKACKNISLEGGDFMEYIGVAYNSETELDFELIDPMCFINLCIANTACGINA